eukprot:m.9243 g.9243  ORF g.9243 m.9243 type:complete len:171 (+) comp5677_c0_seq1:129-641(+)
MNSNNSFCFHLKQNRIQSLTRDQDEEEEIHLVLDKMEDEAAVKMTVAGMQFDELSKIRVLDPEMHEQTENLGEECRAFLEKINTFHSVMGGLVSMMDRLSKAVDDEKMKAIGARAAVESLSKKRESEEQLLLAMIAEKRAQLDRLQVEQESLEKVIQDQEQFITNYVMNK